MMLKTIERRIEVGVQTSRSSVLAGTLASMFVLYGLNLWHNPPEFCNPCINQPNAINSIPLPAEALIVWIYSGQREAWVSVYSTVSGTTEFGTAHEVSEIEGLIRKAVDAYPGVPIVVKGDRDARFALFQAVINALGSIGLGEAYFETENGPRDPA